MLSSPTLTAASSLTRQAALLAYTSVVRGCGASYPQPVLAVLPTAVTCATDDPSCAGASVHRLLVCEHDSQRPARSAVQVVLHSYNCLIQGRDCSAFVCYCKCVSITVRASKRVSINACACKQVSITVSMCRHHRVGVSASPCMHVLSSVQSGLLGAAPSAGASITCSLIIWLGDTSISNLLTWF
jgi:hypothetical protein